MSDTLRELVVSLSLNSDDFTRNIKTINAQIKEAQSTFQLAAAGADGFESSIGGLRSKIGTLDKQLALQNQAVEQYERALASAEKKMRTNYDMQGRLNERLAQARRRLSELNNEVPEMERVYKAYSEGFGEADDSTIYAKECLEQLNKELAATEKEIKKLEGQIKAESKTLQRNADDISNTKTALNLAKAEVTKTSAEIEKATKKLKENSSAWKKAADDLDQFAKSAESISKTTGKIGDGFNRYVTAPLAGIGVAAAKASIDFESSFADVRKTVDATESQYDKLNVAITKSSEAIATGAGNIAQVVALGGQMGIEYENLMKFSRVVIDLSNSTNIAAEEGAQTLAKFRNVTNMSANDFDRLGSSLVALGNNTAATEDDIMNMAFRLAGAGTQVGMTQAQILGLAASLSAVGLEAEGGGTAMSKALTKMEVAVETGSEALADFARVSGMTDKQFSELFKADPAAALTALIAGLAKMDDAGISTIVTLQELGFQEVRLRDTTLRTVNANEMLTKNIELSNQAWDENVALSDEANKRYSTTASRLINLKNKGVNLLRVYGDDLKPVIHDLIDESSDLIDRLAEMDSSQRQNIMQLAGIAIGVGPALKAFSKLSGGASAVAKKLGAFAGSVASAGGGIKGLVAVVSKSPVAWLALGSGILYATRTLYEYTTEAGKAKKAIRELNDIADEWESHNAESFYEQDALSYFGLSTADFDGTKDAEKSIKNAQDWRDGLIAVWTDGKRESNAIVSEWTNSFAALNEGIIQSLTEMREEAAAGGYDGVASGIQSDIDALKSMDEEIAKLLKRRQSKLLTEKEKLRLDELIDTRQAIQVKYSLVGEEKGYQAILDQIEAERARANAENRTIDTSVYEKGAAAALQGYAAMQEAVDKRYDDEFAIIKMIEDEGERERAQEALDRRYRAERLANAQEYANVVEGMLPPVWDDKGMVETRDTLNEISQLLVEYQTSSDKGTILSRIQDEVENLNEDDLVNYLALLTQAKTLIQEGVSEADVDAMFGIGESEDSATRLLGRFKEIGDFASKNKSMFGGLADIFTGDVPEEMKEIFVSLNMEQAVADWEAFAANPGSQVESSLFITGYDNAAYQKFLADFPETPVQATMHFDDAFKDIEDALSGDHKVFTYDPNTGVKLPITPEAAKLLTGDEFCVKDTDGNVTVFITPKVSGSSEAIKSVSDSLKEIKGNDTGIYWGEKELVDIPRDNWFSQIQSKYTDAWKELEFIRQMANTANRDGIFDMLLKPLRTGNIEKSISENFNSEDVSNLQIFIQEVAKAIMSGNDVSEEDLAHFGLVLDTINSLKAIGVGENLTSGIDAALGGIASTEELLTAVQNMKSVGEDLSGGVAEGMTDYSYDADGKTVWDHIESALNAAMDRHSPAQKAVPIGSDVSAGVAEGMMAYSFDSAASAVSAKVISATSAAASYSKMRSIGYNAAAGLANGLLAGKGSVTTAAKDVANSIVNTSKQELEINSPSRRMEDEVGALAADGGVNGYIKQMKARSKEIANASSYLVSASRGAIGANASYDNRSTYNNTANSTVNVQTLVVRDQQDIQSLAIEIASFIKYKQAGIGVT